MNETEWLNELEERFIDVNGISLHTVIIGNGKPLVLLHGFPEFWYSWRHLIPQLKTDFQLIIPDLRGYNLSDKPDGVDNYHIDLLVSDVIGIIESLGFEEVYLAGHDWGGVLAWCVAEKHPNFISKLVILNAPHLKIFQDLLKNNQEQQKASYYIFEFLKPEEENNLIRDDCKRLQTALIAGLSNNPKLTEIDKERIRAAWDQPGTLLAGVNYYRANLDYKDWTGMIHVPTLVIHGMKDTAILPVVLNGLKEYVKELQIVRDENSGHTVMSDNPQLVINEFRAFFLN